MKSIRSVESSFSKYCFNVDYVASAVVLYFICCVHFITIMLISSVLNNLRSVTYEIRKERRGNFQQFIGRLSND